jgi:hypothetical protein
MGKTTEAMPFHWSRRWMGEGGLVVKDPLKNGFPLKDQFPCKNRRVGELTNYFVA